MPPFGLPDLDALKASASDALSRALYSSKYKTTPKRCPKSKTFETIISESSDSVALHKKASSITTFLSGDETKNAKDWHWVHEHERQVADGRVELRERAGEQLTWEQKQPRRIVAPWQVRNGVAREMEGRQEASSSGAGEKGEISGGGIEEEGPRHKAALEALHSQQAAHAVIRSRLVRASTLGPLLLQRPDDLENPCASSSSHSAPLPCPDPRAPHSAHQPPVRAATVSMSGGGLMARRLSALPVLPDSPSCASPAAASGLAHMSSSGVCLAPTSSQQRSPPASSSAAEGPTPLVLPSIMKASAARSRSVEPPSSLAAAAASSAASGRLSLLTDTSSRAPTSAAAPAPPPRSRSVEPWQLGHAAASGRAHPPAHRSSSVPSLLGTNGAGADVNTMAHLVTWDACSTDDEDDAHDAREWSVPRERVTWGCGSSGGAGTEASVLNAPSPAAVLQQPAVPAPGLTHKHRQNVVSNGRSSRTYSGGDNHGGASGGPFPSGPHQLAPLSRTPEPPATSPAPQLPNIRRAATFLPGQLNNGVVHQQLADRLRSSAASPSPIDPLFHSSLSGSVLGAEEASRGKGGPQPPQPLAMPHPKASPCINVTVDARQPGAADTCDDEGDSAMAQLPLLVAC